MNDFMIWLAAGFYNLALFLVPIALVGWWYEWRYERPMARHMLTHEWGNLEHEAKRRRLEKAGCLPAIIALIVLLFLTHWLDANGHQILREAHRLRDAAGY